MNRSQLQTDDLEGINEYWEGQVVDPFIRSCVRGIWDWIEASGPGDITIKYGEILPDPRK